MAKAAIKSPEKAEKPAKRTIKAKAPAKGKRTTPAERAGSWIHEICTKADLSLLMGISMRALSDMDARGLLVRGSKQGTFRTIPSLNARFKYLQEAAAGRAADLVNPLAEEKIAAERVNRQIQEIKLAQLKGDVMTLQEVSESWSEFATKVKSSMLTVPTKARSAIPHLTAHDAEELKIIVKDMLNDLADEIEGSVAAGDGNDLKA